MPPGRQRVRPRVVCVLGLLGGVAVARTPGPIPRSEEIESLRP